MAQGQLKHNCQSQFFMPVDNERMSPRRHLNLVCESTGPLQPVSRWFWKAWSLSAFFILCCYCTEVWDEAPTPRSSRKSSLHHNQTSLAWFQPPSMRNGKQLWGRFPVPTGPHHRFLSLYPLGTAHTSSELQKLEATQVCMGILSRGMYPSGKFWGFCFNFFGLFLR